MFGMISTPHSPGTFLSVIFAFLGPCVKKSYLNCSRGFFGHSRHILRGDLQHLEHVYMHVAKGSHGCVAVQTLKCRE